MLCALVRFLKEQHGGIPRLEFHRIWQDLAGSDGI
jgi:hypothetical protein